MFYRSLPNKIAIYAARLLVTGRKIGFIIGQSILHAANQCPKRLAFDGIARPPTQNDGVVTSTNQGFAGMARTIWRNFGLILADRVCEQLDFYRMLWPC